MRMNILPDVVIMPHKQAPFSDLIATRPIINVTAVMLHLTLL